MTWDPTIDERPHIYVHAEAPSSDDARTFYELPSVIADRVHAVAPGVPIVEAMVQVFEGIDEWREVIATLQGQNQQLRDVIAETVDLCNAMREHAPVLNMNAERAIRAGLDAAGRTAETDYQWRVVVDRPESPTYHSGPHDDEASAELFATDLRRDIPHATAVYIQRRTAPGEWS